MSKKYTTNFLEDTNGSTGSANQVLVSTAAGIDWVDGSGSGIIGGPYLPLSAGASYPLTGNLYLEGADKSLRINNGTQPVVFLGDGGANTDGQLILYSSTGVANVVFNGDNQNHYITNGNVGIGTTSPSQKLHVSSSANANWTTTFQNTLNSNSHSVYTAYNNSSSNLRYGVYIQGAGTTASDYHLLVNDQFAVVGNGDVGIGTTSPSAKLDVDGVIRSRGGTYSAASDTKTDVGLVIAENDFIYTADNSNLRKLIGKTSDIITIGEAGTSLTDGINLMPGGSGGYVQIFNNSSVAAKFVDGKLGIGTTSPGAKLEVDTSLASEYGTYIHNQSSTGKGLLVKTNNDTSSDPVLWVGRNNQNPSLFVGGGANGGNVGIGTDSPGAKLEILNVSPSDGFSAQLKLTSSETTGAVDTGGALAFTGNNGVGNSVWAYIRGMKANSIVSNNDSYLSFATRAAGGIPTEKMRITSTGNVGIGDTPSFKLDVNVTSSRARFKATSGDANIELSSIAGHDWLIQSKSDSSLAIYDEDEASERMRITSTGNVGIGTTSPDTLLHIKGEADDNESLLYVENTHSGGTQYPSAMFTNTNGDHSFGTIAEFRTGNVAGWDRPSILFTNGATTNNWSVGQGVYSANDNFAIGFRTAHPGVVSAWADPKLVILTSGNVGIGTTSPRTKLNVSGSSADGGGVLTLENSTTATGNADYVGKIQFYGNDSGTGASGIRASIDANIQGYNGETDLVFSTAPASGVNAEAMRIDHDGNVGIGTINPSAKLEVEGTTSPQAKIGYDANNYVQVSVNGVGDTSIAPTGNGIIPADLTLSAGSAYVKLDAQTNNVGIGTTSPDFKLDVNGDVRISSDQTNLIKISNESNEDYFNVSQSTNNKPTLSLGDIDEQYGTLLTVDVENEEVVIFTNGQIYIGDNGFGNSTKFIVDDVNEKFTFTNGDVGIGTTSPSQKLEVDGNVKAETLIATDLNDGYVPYSKSGTLGLQDSKIYTNGAGIGVGTTTLAAGCHITSLSDISATGYRVSAMQTAPSSRGDTGTLGEIRITADYIYVCYATDSWKRVAIAQW